MSELAALDLDGRMVAPESKTREYKRDLSSPDGVIKDIVAFANSAGGHLFIGVDDDLTVVGVDDPLAEEERIASLIADRIEPQLVPGIDIITLAERSVLVVDVPLSTRRPHFVKKLGQERGTYVRLGTTCRAADAALVAELERSARGIAFESLPEPRARLTDLDLPVLSDIRRKETTKADLIALGLAAREGGRTCPTNAGILAASPHPDRYLPSAWIQCGRFRGIDRVDILDQREIHTYLPRAVDEVVEFLHKHAYLSAEFGDTVRKDVWSIPVTAIREVVVNALVHANYAEGGTPIRVAFHDDRIVVESPGLLMAGLTVDTLIGVSRLRNPALARVFRDAGLIEQWGSGLQRVVAEVATAGHGELGIEEVVDRVRVTVPIRPHTVLDDSLSESLRQSLSHEDVTMMEFMVTGAKSRAELLARAGIRNETRNYQRRIEPLLEAGFVERTVPDKPRSKDQKYRLTPVGRAMLTSRPGGGSHL